MKTASLYQPVPPQHRYLLRKTITWGDATTETVDIDTDGWIYLNGVKAKRVGFSDSLQFAEGDYWDAGNLVIFHTELDYMVSKGVRLIQLNLEYSGLNNDAAYAAILDLCYSHKMLVIATWTAKYYASLIDDFVTTNFSMGDETVSQAYTKWVTDIIAYQNVITLNLENELDYPIPGHTYTIANLTLYLDQMYTIARGLTTLPINSKLCGGDITAAQLAVHNLVYSYSAIPCFDTYENTSVEFYDDCIKQQAWYNRKGKTSKMWFSEFNFSDGTVTAASLTVDMVNTVLAQDVSVILLWSVNCTSMQAGCFFDATGTKIANTDTLMAQMATWQAAI